MPLRVILASKSKARRLLMKELGIPFECHPSGYEENMQLFSSPGKLARHLAVGKAKFIASKFHDALIIGADTFITIGKNKIGKPSSYQEAESIIRKMSGNTIKVHSGIAVIATDQDGQVKKELSGHVITALKIKKLSAREIHVLAHHDEALQISGAFSIEGEGGKMVEKIDGDYSNVIGLPLLELRKMLIEIGLHHLA